MESPNTNNIASETRSPPQQNEPDHKKTKITSDNQNSTKPQRYKRRKIAIFFAYCGVNYQGMQKNPGAKTIEGELEEALYHAGAVPIEDRNAPRRYDWARSARTDKGVSAVGQVVSGRFYVDPPGFVDRLNGLLPDQIRVFGFKRTTPQFNAKKFCDRRRYVYLVPVFALDPSFQFVSENCLGIKNEVEDAEKMLNSQSGNNPSVHWDRGSVVCGSGNEPSFETENTVVDEDNCLDGNDGMNDSGINSEVKEEIMISAGNEGAEKMSNSEIKISGNGAVMSELELKVEDEVKGELMDDRMNKVADETSNRKERFAKKGEFTYGKQEKERFNRILKYYVGTHNFHNFTSRTTAQDPSAIRYILAFNADTTVTVEGIEFVKCEVVGQSFMLHQIRNMIGLAVAVMRNCAPESLIETAFSKDVKINMPMAPEVGLYLDECLFTSYNKKWQKTHEELSMKDYEKEAEDFKMKYIYSHIASTEHKEGVVARWLQYINVNDYPDLCFAGSREAVGVKDTCKATAGAIPEENDAGEEKITAEIPEENGTGEEKITGEFLEENGTGEEKMTGEMLGGIGTGDIHEDVTGQEKMD